MANISYSQMNVELYVQCGGQTASFRGSQKYADNFAWIWLHPHDNKKQGHPKSGHLKGERNATSS